MDYKISFAKHIIRKIMSGELHEFTIYNDGTLDIVIANHTKLYDSGCITDYMPFVNVRFADGVPNSYISIVNSGNKVDGELCRIDSFRSSITVRDILEIFRDDLVFV